MSGISVFQLSHGLNKQIIANHLVVAIAVIGVLVFSFQSIIGCAPSSTSGIGVVGEAIDYDFNRPVDLSSGVQPMIIPPPHDIGEDCNHNGVNDTYDRAGLFPRGPYTISFSPKALAAGDLNGDGLLDLAVAGNEDSSTVKVAVLLQNPMRDFEEIETIDLGNHGESYSIAIVDIDGDGEERHSDILVPSMWTVDGALDRQAIILLQNDGSGEDFVQTELPISDNLTLNEIPRCVIATNFDEGGEEILATSGQTDSSLPDAPSGNKMITLFSNGGLDTPQHNFLIKKPYALIAADLDNDSDIDLAVICETRTSDGVLNPRKICVLNNRSNTDFSNWARNCYHLNITAQATMDTGDLDGDGDIDIAAVGSEGVDILDNQQDVHANLSAMSPDLFDEAINYEVPGAQAIVVADADGDGDKDIVLPVTENDVLTIMVNTGGRFSDSASQLINLPVQDGPRTIVAGDLDRDGRMEFAVANENSNDLWIIHSRPSPILGLSDCRPLEGGSPPTP